MRFFKHRSEIDESKYFIATYEIETDADLRSAAWQIAIGQSVGNPNVRNSWETDELFENHSCIILNDESLLEILTYGTIQIAFPIINTDWATDGISHLLCQIMGGHVDIDMIKKCRLVKLELPQEVEDCFSRSKYGIDGIRRFTNQYDKPILGGIVKPKTGLSPDRLLDMVKQMVDGGVDFIKEDEIMSNPVFCKLEERVELIANYLATQSRKVIFCHTVNGDPHNILKRVEQVYMLGGNGVHINVWSGLGVYNSARKLNLPLFLHLQSSGAKAFTEKNNKFSIAWPVICYLASLMGVDTIQTGMIGGYSNDDPDEILECLNILHRHDTLPTLSCGFHAGLVDKVTSIVGHDYLVNVGGAIHGHPGGTLAGAKAMRQAIDKIYDIEYHQAIEKWGKE